MVPDGECHGLELFSVTGCVESSGPGRNLRLMAVSTVDRGCRLALGATGKRLVFPGAIDLNRLEFCVVLAISKWGSTCFGCILTLVGEMP